MQPCVHSIILRKGARPLESRSSTQTRVDEVVILTDQRPELAVVDRGYRGHGEEKTRVVISGMRRGLTPKMVADLRRQSDIKAEIDNMKTDGGLSRGPLKGTLGDAVFAVLCACCHNIRKILAHLSALLAWIIVTILTSVNVHGRDLQMLRSS